MWAIWVGVVLTYSNLFVLTPNRLPVRFPIMFGKDFWKILKILYVVIRALIMMPPPGNGDLPNVKDMEDKES